MASCLKSDRWRGEFSSREQPSCGTLARVSTVSRQRMQVFYSGHVQGVGFRYTVKSAARGFDVVGWVRNLADGRVEMVAEGTRDELEAFRQVLRESGLGPFITNEGVSWGEAQTAFRGFGSVS